VIPDASYGDWIYADEPGPGISWTYAYYWDGWKGPLTYLTPGAGYFYNRAGSDFNLTIIGKPLAEVNTTIYTGWNLIGYAKDVSMPLSDAIGPEYNPTGDMIFGDIAGPGISWKSAVYIEGVGWYSPDGELTELVPGEGYFYYREGNVFNWTYTDIQLS